MLLSHHLMSGPQFSNQPRSSGTFFSVVKEIAAHDNKIQCLSYNLHQTFLLSASTDHTCKMWDVETWDCVKTFKSDRPLNACVFSPTKEHVLLGGGQDAMSVTTTAGR